MTDTSRTISIPGKPTLFKTVDIPDEAVTLPLLVDAKRAALAAAAALCIVMAAMALGALWIALPQPRHPDQSTFVTVMHAVLLIGVGLTFPLIGGTAFADAVRRTPAVCIDHEAVHDARAGVSVPWSSVQSAQVGYWRYGPVNVTLTLDQPVSAKRNPFRLGGGLQWRQRAPQLCIPLLALDRDPDFLARLLIELARANGARIQT